MKAAIACLLLCLLVVALFGCGGNNPQSNYNPPPPIVSISLSATAATVQTTGYNDAGMNQFQFTATVQNATDTSVTWDVNGQLADNDTAYGKISSTGLYTAPMLMPSEQVVIHATANADRSKSASASITLQWAAQLYNLQVASSVETSTSTPMQLFFSTYGPTDVDWTINGVPMGSAAAGAVALDSNRYSGKYIAPASVPAAPVRVTATWRANGKSLSKDITITANSDPNTPNLVVSPSSATLHPGETQAFAVASSGGDPVPGAFWTMGSGIHDASDGFYGYVLREGVLRPNGTYTAPYDVPDNRVVVVTATYNGSTTRAGYAIVNLADPAVDPNSRLQGQYAFSFHDSQYMNTALGTLVADGAGNLTGTADIMTSAQRGVTGQPFTGTYTAHADGRVQATITFSVAGAQTLTQSLSLMLVSDTRAYAFTTGSLGTLVGAVEKQETAALNNTSIVGDYGFLLRGTSYAFVNNNQIATPYAWAGVLTLNSDLTVSGSGTFDDGSVRPDADISGDYGFNPTTGTGIMTVVSCETAFQFSFAVISANKLLLATSNALVLNGSTPIFDGFAERRTVTPPLNAASFTGPFVFYLGGQQFVEAGHFSADGRGGISTGLVDMRDTSSSATTHSLEWTTFTGSYTMDADDPYGRGHLQLMLSPQHTTAYIQQNARFYMIAPNKIILLMDSMTSAIAGEAFAESLSPWVPDDGRYAVHFVGPDMMHYATGWTMPLVLNGGTPWVGWLDTIGSLKSEWELSVQGEQSNDVYTFWALPLGQSFRAYAISPSRLLLIGLDTGASPNQLVWMERVDSTPPQ